MPGDKSISHRALLLGAIAEGATRVRNFLPAADCLATWRCIETLGVKVQQFDRTTLVVHGLDLYGLQEPDDVLDCAGSATTMRLLSGILAGQPFHSVLTGNVSLRSRPMARIVQPLRQMGATMWGRNDDRLPPLSIRGGRLQGIDYALPVASAQVKSAILLAGLYAESPTTVHEPAPARDHTERMLRAQGAKLKVQENSITLAPTDRLKAMDITIPGDISSASFLIAAACLVPRSEIVIEGVGVNPTRTGFLEVLKTMGSAIVLENRQERGGEPVADIVVCGSPGLKPGLRGGKVGGDLVPRMIDEFPILAVAATQAEGETVVHDAAELRVKETDRIAAIAAELRKMGACIEEKPDGFIVEGPTILRGAHVDSHGDHRLAMSLIVAGLLAEGETTVEGSERIKDSFPGFEEILMALGSQSRFSTARP